MPPQSARLQYTLLSLVALLSLVLTVHGITAIWNGVFHSSSSVQIPLQFGAKLNVIETLTPEAQAAGLAKGQTVISFNGRPFVGYRIFLEEMRAARAGDELVTVYRNAKGEEQTTHIHLVAEDGGVPQSWFYIVTQDFLLRVLLPIGCLVLGCWVVIAKPHDPNAWLLLGIFNFFLTILLPSMYWTGAWLYVVPIWADTINSAGPLCIMLFGMYFPERAYLDQRLPWVKWTIVGLVLTALPLDLYFNAGFLFNFSAIPWAPSIMGPVTRFETALIFIAISLFFACIAQKVGTTKNPDTRRRLRILYVGSAIANAPIALLLLYSLSRGKSMSDSIPQWILITAVAVFTLFPATLAYVVVVQRAMDVRILVRQGTKYFFARGTLFAIGVLLAIRMTYSINLYIGRPTHRRLVDKFAIAGAIILFFTFRFFMSKRLQQRIDQRFFREAYSSELVLSELSEEVRNFTEVTPLIDTISSRIGSTLHVERIAVFLRVGETFQLAHTTGSALLPGSSLSLPAASTTIRTLTRSKGPANVYRDDPGSWLVDATDAERNALADLSTELLVPLPGRGRLIGVMALGPKRSEEPYSRTDRQLLQTVASQTGLALENAELLENLSSEISQRERVSREIEIAREVQQRLFPQSYPSVEGIGLAGYCRPAQAVGGDYYDFFLLPAADGNQPRLAIAIGDISGKGISAALLMASLRASLRSIAGLQAESGSNDLTTLMRSVNRLVYDSSTSSRYATFFYAEYDPASRLLTYVNAGHNPPVLLRGTQTIPLEPTGMVIGLMPEAEYEQSTLPLNPGDVLLAFTDGISEAMTHAEEEWGEDRMFLCARDFLDCAKPPAPAQHLLDCILKAADSFTAGAPQHDDMTLVICTVS